MNEAKRMRHFPKQLICVLMALAMILTLLPVTTKADDGTAVKIGVRDLILGKYYIDDSEYGTMPGSASDYNYYFYKDDAGYNLELNNCNLGSVENVDSAIIVDGDLNIIIKGECKISGDYSYGIRTETPDDTITFTGGENDSLKIIASGKYSRGVIAGRIVADCSNLFVTGTSCAFCVYSSDETDFVASGSAEFNDLNGSSKVKLAYIKTYYYSVLDDGKTMCKSAYVESAEYAEPQYKVTCKVTTPKTYKATTLKKSAKTFLAIKVTYNAPSAKIKYTVAKYGKNAKKYLTFNTKTGKITVKKGTPKGTYLIKLKATATAKNYPTKTKIKVIKVIVK